MMLHTPSLFGLATLILLFFSNASALAQNSRDEILSKFDHRGHELKVFDKQNLDCSTCHHFRLDLQSKELVPLPGFERAHLNRPLKQICHECHKTAEAKHSGAPKSCVLCHRTSAAMASIAPANHNNINWGKAHATLARAGGSQCSDCHTSSQCVKCHLQRNDIVPINHSRNYRFFHSVDARLEPHRCDACHTKSYCNDCHTGSPKR